jgi:TetR/AcrR family transcriptional regulator, cholesterol catabolism regulator
VIGDVWLASLVQWVTGRANAEDVSKSIDMAVKLLLR